MSVDGIQIALCAVGAFYAFAGYVATRVALTSHFVDRAIAAIACKRPSKTETAQSYWLLAAATLVLAGGVALLFLIDVAAFLFLLSAIGQALYLFYVAPRYFDVEDAPDAVGRRRSINAFVIYLVATAFVVWALSAGKLASWQDVGWPWLALTAALVAAHVGYIVHTLAGSPAAKPLFASPDADGDTGRDPSQSTRIKVMADYYAHPLWALDEDLYGDFPPEALELSPELAQDLNAWAEAFTSSLDPDNPAESRWSEAERQAHEAMARPLAVRLARERPDRTIFVLEAETGVVEVRPDGY
ncbi:hypothetical protein [Hyphomicrobium sp.]|uniref:hypothetical protein n=1 Tax=Hyphomicrobium sp. TaxID=82 RepID=UPI0025C4B376|nr:hypothetical protein [Hyphomicrobium sp.]MCC7250830.1 hypothetical protein [Hyphomicrobium sp.]